MPPSPAGEKVEAGIFTRLAGLGELATQPQLTLPQGRGIYTIYIPKWTRI